MIFEDQLAALEADSKRVGTQGQDTPLEEAERRDVKGLYRKAREGQLKNFTGIDSPYEAPETPDIRIDTTAMTPEEAAEHIIRSILPLK